VEVFNDPASAAAGDLSPIVRFGDLVLPPRAVGYGAAGGRTDEITIADGRLYLVRPGVDGAPRSRHGAESGEGALMLQLIPVRSWRAATRLTGVASLDELAARLDRAVADAGCAGGAKLAFRIEGRARRATWSLDTRPERAEFTSGGERVVIVGLYATQDGDRHAIPTGRRFHAHVVFPDRDVAGHLRAVTLEDGASMRLQAR
jgi:hypothetical protein